MIARHVVLLAGAAALLAGGCATPAKPPAGRPVPAPIAPQSAAPVPPTAETTPAPAVVPRPSVAPAKRPPAPADSAPVAPAGKLYLRVESEPAGATIVVDGIAVGRAPTTILVAATPQGYFAGEVVVRARFLAAGAGSESESVTERFTTLDRVPAVVVFRATGVQRLAR